MTSQEREDGTFDPSPLTLLLGTSKTTEYAPQTFETKYTGTKPLLVVCTDTGGMEMANGKTFNTGNHPVEMLVPMLHFRDAGFTFDIVTPTGKPVVMEMWAFPTKDQNVIDLQKSIQADLDDPKKLSEIPNVDAYAGIFIPGGHGAMISLPESIDLGRLLREAHVQKLPTITLCHGPAALLATKTNGNKFAYSSYEAFCFTDKTDEATPGYGYLPGPMPWKCQECLEKEGLKITNSTETGGVHTDRELITGDSPSAANNLGVIAAPILLKHALEEDK